MAQPPAVQWTRSYIVDVPNPLEVIQTLDGGYITAGTSQIYTPFLYKVTAAGDPQFVAHAYAQGGLPGHSTKDVIQNPDSSYTVVGTNYQNPFGARYWYCSRVSPTGVTIWGSIVSGSAVYGDPWSLARRPGGGFVIGGDNAPDLMCIADSGGSLYERNFDGNLYSVVPLADGTYTGGGTILSGPTAEDFYLVHTDNVGQMVWQCTYALPGRQICYWMDPTSDGGYVFAGYDSVAADGSTDQLFVRVNSAGDTVWTRRFNMSSFEYAFDIHETADGGFITLSYIGGLSLLMKLDAAGDSVWSVMMNAYAMSPTSDHGYIVAGMNTQHLILTKFAPDNPPPPAPQEVTVCVAGSNLTLRWHSVTGVTSYQVYSADASNGTYAEDLSGTFADTTWTTPAASAQKFYYVTAVQ